MILLADRHIPWLDELLPPDVTLHRFDGGRPPASFLSQAEALLIRTVTRVDDDLLASATNLKWIGTATAGFDHVDVDAVRAAGVKLYVAAGCNARAVGDYVQRAVRQVRGHDPLASHMAPLTSCAIVGYGHTGRAAAAQLKQIGVRVVPFDPPLGLSATWDEALACDAVSFHVPLTFDGAYMTHHMLTASDFARANWRLLIQASRGGVVDESALKAWISPGVRDAVVDVWENEPSPDPELVGLAALATPHIAGYSVEAKFRATRMCLSALFSVEEGGLNLSPCFNLGSSAPTLPAENSDFIANYRVVNDPRLKPGDRIDPLQSLSNQLKASPTAETFKRLRNESPLRSEAK